MVENQSEGNFTIFRALPNGVKNSEYFTVILLFTVEYSNGKILAIEYSTVQRIPSNISIF